MANPPSKFRKAVKFAAVSLLLLGCYLAWQVWDIHRVGHSDDGASADCAIVLGAAAYHNRPSPVFKARIDHAIKLYQEGRVKTILLTGGYGKQAEFAESEVAYRYCRQLGVPKEALFLEKKSKTTEQNLKQAVLLMEEHGLDSALLVSDPWHLKRALAMARKHDLSASASATQTTMYRSEESRFRFLLRELYNLHVWRLAGE